MKINLKEKFYMQWNHSPCNVALSLVHNYTLSFQQCIAAMSQMDIRKHPIGYLMSEAYFKELEFESGYSYLIPAMEHVFRFYEHENEPDIINTHPPKAAVSDAARKRIALMKITNRYHKPLDKLFSTTEISEMNNGEKVLFDSIIRKDISLQGRSKLVVDFALYLYTVAESDQPPVLIQPNYSDCSVRDLYFICKEGYELFQWELNTYRVPVLTLDEVMILNRYGTECVNVNDIICRLSEHCKSLTQKVAGIPEEAGSYLLARLAADGVRYSPPYYLE